MLKILINDDLIKEWSGDGVKIMKDYGAVEFFNEYRPKLLEKKLDKINEILSAMLYNLVKNKEYVDIVEQKKSLKII